MNNISLNAVGNKLSITGGSELLSGSFSYDKCVFTFDSEWSGHTVTVVFSKGNSEEKTVILSDNYCSVPEEMVRTPGLLKIGVVGINPAGTIISTNLVSLRVRSGANESGTMPTAVAIEMRESGGGAG